MTTQAEVGYRALDWLLSERHRFDAVKGGKGPLWLHKALVELAVVCMQMAGDARFARSQAVDQLTRDVVVLHLSPAFRARMLRVRGAFLESLWLEVCLRAAAEHETSIEDNRRYQTLADSNRSFLRENAPHRVLENRYVLDRAGICHHLPPVGEIVDQSLLRQPIHLLHVTDSEVYALTHLLFYLTDFGTTAVSRDVEVSEHLPWVVERLIGIYICRQNLDLLGELLMLAGPVGLGESRLVAAGWDCLAASQHDNGMVPGPGFATSEEPSDEDVFRHCHHTTMVACLASVASGRADW